MSDDNDFEQLSEKWGVDIINGGWSAIPNALLKHQNELGIDSVELVVLMNLIRFWWERERPPFPSPAKIAAEMGVSNRTVHRKLKSLEDKGFLKRGQTKAGTTFYSLEGLVQRLNMVV